jgi:hypothetical protein
LPTGEADNRRTGRRGRAASWAKDGIYIKDGI